MHVRLKIVAVALLMGNGGAWANDRLDRLPGPIPARVIRVIDGDTVVVRARIWLGQDVTVPIRLAGIDAPEVHAHCDREQELADRAANVAAARLRPDVAVELRDIRADKYGRRVLSRVVTAEGEDVGQTLLAQGLARPYAGHRRAGWCKGAAAADAGRR